MRVFTVLLHMQLVLQNYLTFNRNVFPRISRQSTCLRISQVRTEAAKWAIFIMVLKFIVNFKLDLVL